jgi:hypothetical protein
MSVLTDLLALIPLLNKLGKKKRFIVWYMGPDHTPYLLSHFAILRDSVTPGPNWIKKSGPMSFRQCEKTRKALWMLGP